jgi:anti-sigma-K factor RskA
MNCPIENTDTVDLVLDYCAGKLPELKAEAFERHMQVCTECRDFVRAQHEVLTAMEDWQEEPVSADFDRRLYERIAEADRRRSWRQWLADKAAWRPALSIGAACAALAVVLFVQAPDSPKVDPPPVATVEIEPELVESALDDLEMLRQLSAPNSSQSL